MQSISKILPLATLALLAPVVSTAEEVIEFEMNLGDGALICDMPQSVVQAIDGEAPSDCGVLRTSTGRMITVTVMGEYQGYVLAQFSFHNPTPWGVDVQYGFLGDNVPLEPAGLDI